MPNKEERAAVKAAKESVKAAKAQAKIDAKAAKEKEKADAKAAKAAAKAEKKAGGVSVPPPGVPVNAQVPDYSHITYEGAKIVAILPNKHTKNEFHCKMSDGSTKHVPKRLFE